MADAIFTSGLTKYYGGRRVVNSLDLRVPEGSVYGLLGRNGSGKSTTLKMLMGLVRPDRGQAQLLGQDIADLPIETKARIAYIAEGHPFLRWMTVGEAVNFTRAFYTRWNQELLEQILEHFALPRRAKIRRLSNGQRAQISLALAVAPDPELLVLDDPTLGLDTVVRRDFLESLIQLIQRRGRTILISSHILADVERVADRIGVMVDGVLRVDAPVDTFKSAVRKVVLEYVGEPPRFPACEGLVSTWRVGNRLEVVLVGFGPTQQQAIESTSPLAVDVLELNLEDAFIEYTRGERRALPLLAVEKHSDERTCVKELREILGLAALGLVALLFLAGAKMGYPILAMFIGIDGQSIPLVNDGFGFGFVVICGLLAIALGLRQSLGDFAGAAHLFLLHRPMSRVQMFGIKLAVGLSTLLLCSGLAVGLYIGWASTPGTHASPFEWSMAGELCWHWLAMSGVYLGAFMTGIRPGRWFGARLAPLVAALTLVLMSMAPPLNLAFPILLFTDGLLVAGIMATVETREFG